MIFSCIPASALESNHAVWPEPSTGDGYIANNGFVHFNGVETGYQFSLPTYYCVEIALPTALENYYLEPVYFTRVQNIDGVFYDSGIKFGEDNLQKRCRIEPLVSGAVDYTSMQYWRFYDAYTDRSVVFPVLMYVDDPADDEKNINKLETYAERAEKFVSLMKRFDTLYDELEASQNASAVKYGGHHPYDINLLCKVANNIQRELGVSIGYFDTHDYWIEGYGWESATADDIIKFWTEYINYGSNRPVITSDDLMSQNELNKLDRLLDIVGPYWINYIENHRIEDIGIASYTVNGSRGIVDSDAKKVTIRLPENTDWNSLPKPVVELDGEGVYSFFAGSLESGEALYQLTPADLATGTFYNGNDTTGYGFGINLSSTWTVVVEEGTPYNRVFSFSITTADGKDRYAIVTDPEGDGHGTISLNLPYQTDLSALSPVVDIAGDGYYYIVDGQRIDDTDGIDLTKHTELVVYNSEYDLETIYDLLVTANKSSENSIISYKIGDAVGQINEDEISITVPYATDLTAANVEIEISEFAQITKSPETLTIGENEYEVTAEDGSKRSYTVTISRAAVSTEKKILSFKYGGYTAAIDETTASIELIVPQGISTTFAPDIEISEYATVEPKSGVVQDFSSPVKYKVTAQNGSSKTYTVRVEVQGQAAENVYKTDLESIVEKIISRYRTQASDDWEWMDLGFYEGISENYNSGQGHDFNVANEISELDASNSVAMTTLARTIMMLTARGFDCTDLAQYNGGEPCIDSKGNPVDDLISVLYNYSGTYTSNGPVFALLALDMGNYTIPDDALWTRDNLLNTILGNTTSEFGIDSVGMVMYSIAPYIDDALYGSRVESRLQDCLQEVIDSMNSDYSFGAWGATNSESAGWIMMGLCSMGIDCNIDPRFSDGQGHSMLQHWMDNFANVKDGYFHHSASLLNNYMATYEGCYAAMWYLDFLEGGGQGHPYSLYYDRFDFSKALSTDASILEFEIEGRFGVITEGESNTIEVTLAKGTPISNISPKITFAEGAKLVSPNLPVTFVEGVSQPFVVRAEDGQTYKIYNVTITYDNSAASGAELYLDTLKVFNSRHVEETASRTVTIAEDGATEVLLTVKPQVDTSKMYLYAEVSYAAECNPVLDGNTLIDLSDWITVTVKSEDEANTNIYRIKVEAKQQAEITSFSVIANGVSYAGIIDNTKNTIIVRNVDDSNLTSTVLVTDIVFTGLTCVPSSGIATDFASAVTYTLGGDSTLASRSYTVSVLNKEGKYITTNGSGSGSGNQDDNEVKILSFKVLGVNGVIDHDAGIITVTLPQGTDVRAVIPEVVLTQNATVSPSQGQVVNLSSPVVYTVSVSGKTRSYIVSVVYERTISQQLWDALSEESDVVDHQISYGRGLH